MNERTVKVCQEYWANKDNIIDTDILSAISYLESIYAKALADGAIESSIRIETYTERAYYSNETYESLHVVYERYETDKERELREKREERQKERDKESREKAKAKKEAQEKKELERLKKKYESAQSKGQPE